MHLVKRLFAEFEFIAALLSQQTYAIYVHVPRVYWSLSTNRIFILEHSSEYSVSTKAYIRCEQLPMALVLTRILELYDSVIFERGCLCAYSHPGNVSVLWQSSDLEAHPFCVQQSRARLLAPGRYLVTRVGL